MKNALVIGGAGFVGSYLSAALTRRGYSVTAVIRPSTSVALLQALAPNAVIRRIAPDDHHAFSTLFDEDWRESVFYVAGNPRARGRTIFEEMAAHLQPAVTHLLTTLRIAAEAKRPPRVFVRAGTLAEYGDAPTPHSEEMRGIPSTAYGVCALSGTRILEVVDKALPFRVANARLALVYGWLQSTEYLVPLMVQNFLRGEPVVINDPDAVRDLIHVNDVCGALIALAETENPTPGPVNVGSGEAISMQSAAETIADAAGAARNLIRKGDPSLTSGSRRLEMTTDRAAELVGWRAKIKFRDGVRELIDKAKSAGTRP